MQVILYIKFAQNQGAMYTFTKLFQHSVKTMPLKLLGNTYFKKDLPL